MYEENAFSNAGLATVCKASGKHAHGSRRKSARERSGTSEVRRTRILHSSDLACKNNLYSTLLLPSTLISFLPVRR